MSADLIDFAAEAAPPTAVHNVTCHHISDFRILLATFGLVTFELADLEARKKDGSISIP